MTIPIRFTRRAAEALAALLLAAPAPTLAASPSANPPAAAKPATAAKPPIASAPTSRPSADAVLGRKLPEVKFDGVALADALDFLSDISGAKIQVNWDALQAAGVDRDIPVRAQMRNVTWGEALDEVLAKAAGAEGKLHASAEEGRVVVTTRDDYVAHNTEDREYDLQGLLPPGARGNGDDARKLRAVVVDDVTHFIKDAIAPQSWDTAGGKPGVLKESDGRLKITQTKENQRRIEGLLAGLREKRARQEAATTRPVPSAGK